MRADKKKPSLHELDSVLRAELSPHFTEIEALRSSAKRHWVVYLVGLAVITLTIAYVGAAEKKIGQQSGSFQLLIFVWAGFAGLGMWRVAAASKRFNSCFKEKVMKKVAARFFPDLTYQPDGFVSKDLYDESGLFRQELSTYAGNDLFAGRLGEADFRFSELLCRYTTGSGKNKQTHTEFQGFFFVGDFHRPIYFRTTIKPDVAENFLGVLGRGLQRIGSGGRLVDLEDPEFEKLFVVNSDDQVEARYILTPLFMEKLRAFRARVGSNIHLSFVNGKMMLAIETGRDYFEPSLFGEILSRKDLMMFIDMLGLLIGVAEEFLHHPKFGSAPPKMPHPPLPTPAQLAGLRAGGKLGKG